MELATGWDLLAKVMHKDERLFRRKYVGWQPVVIGWKGWRFDGPQK